MPRLEWESHRLDIGLELIFVALSERQTIEHLGSDGSLCVAKNN